MKLPRQRTEDVLAQQVAGELLLYEQRAHHIFALNQSAATVWAHCDGNATLDQVLAALREGAPAADEEWVHETLRAFARAGLLEDDAAVTPPAPSRRTLLRAAGALLLAPAVIGVGAPTVAEAASCRGFLSPCSSSSQCCSGRCGLSGLNLVCL